MRDVARDYSVTTFFGREKIAYTTKLKQKVFGRISNQLRGLHPFLLHRSLLHFSKALTLPNIGLEF
jgi:hypothetical protein